MKYSTWGAADRCKSEATMRSWINAVAVVGGIFCLGMHSIASADIFKCTVGGKAQYQQTPCVSGEEKALDDRSRRMRERERDAKARVAKQEAEALQSPRSASGSGDEGARNARAEQAMRSYFERTLIDPSSIQFRNLKVFLDVPGSKLRAKGSSTSPLVDVVCGEMNSKNRMGGYVGFKHFYWDSDEKQAVGPLDDRELGAMMQDLARRTCSGL